MAESQTPKTLDDVQKAAMQAGRLAGRLANQGSTVTVKLNIGGKDIEIEAEKALVNVSSDGSKFAIALEAHGFFGKDGNVIRTLEDQTSVKQSDFPSEFSNEEIELMKKLMEKGLNANKVAKLQKMLGQ